MTSFSKISTSSRVLTWAACATVVAGETVKSLVDFYKSEIKGITDIMSDSKATQDYLGKYTMPADNLYRKLSKISNINVSMSKMHDKKNKLYPLVIKPTNTCSPQELRNVITIIKRAFHANVQYFYIVFTDDVNMVPFTHILRQQGFHFHHRSEAKKTPQGTS